MADTGRLVNERNQSGRGRHASRVLVHVEREELRASVVFACGRLVQAEDDLEIFRVFVADCEAMGRESSVGSEQRAPNEVEKGKLWHAVVLDEVGFGGRRRGAILWHGGLFLRDVVVIESFASFHP